jgi:hypothetical protein
MRMRHDESDATSGGLVLPAKQRASLSAGHFFPKSEMQSLTFSSGTFILMAAALIRFLPWGFVPAWLPF